jgi:pimeloyl-ACP methyl ester carboxylesterase
VQCPVLIIAGEEDKSAPLKGCRFIFEELSSRGKKGLEVLKGVGHWHCVEAGDEVGRLVKDFVGRLK